MYITTPSKSCFRKYEFLTTNLSLPICHPNSLLYVPVAYIHSLWEILYEYNFTFYCQNPIKLEKLRLV